MMISAKRFPYTGKLVISAKSPRTKSIWSALKGILMMSVTETVILWIKVPLCPLNDKFAKEKK